ncbi:hypothetical protein K443DRAFT_678003 [Laccaria amethystina LaAM-08-1]|uniref:DNA repair protein RAD50 n=1 Tax=Laccaria amethystina LaAM-08-1 TaxID=1095629 RepID=A0A0C9XK21_9AGAR|nr:hypothetical protein K443DRAFT_678003 [Laccaria amethystina LaAM-08-1]
MAHLNKLAIRGIRSFDDKQISIIEFFSPVTVIVGHNGSGKTTIIECLKYATTGDQPPNTRGGAFIHDPKMANEKEVKAQVKLRFHAANGNRMLAVRNLSVTVKKNAGLTMKTLESILSLVDGAGGEGGKRATISTKCAEMDAEIPHLLGVSKAVLENVIFCHQEDSYWPLAEPSALKKKFDDIFEATRYTKALDSIKNLRKERVAELKTEKERLIGLSREKSHADKLKGRIADVNTAIAGKEVEYDETKQQYDEQVEANQKFYDYATKFRESYIKIENLQETKLRMENDLNEAKLSLTEIPGTDDELNSRLQHFDDHINSQKQKKKSQNDKKLDLEDELSAVRQQHTDLVAHHGRLLAEAEQQKTRIADREQFIHETGDKHGIKGYQYSPLEREKVVEFLSRLGDVQRKQKAEFEKFQSDLRSKTEQYNRQTMNLNQELQGHKMRKENLRTRLTELQSSINSAERRLEDQQTLSSDLRTLQGDLEEKKTRVEKLKNDIRSADYDARLAEKTEKARSLEEERENLSGEIRKLSLQADSRAKLDLTRKEIKSKNTEVKTVLDTANLKFRKLVERDLTLETIDHDIDALLLEKEGSQTDLESNVTAANANLQKSSATLTNLKEQLKTKKAELKALERKLKDGFEHGTLQEALKEAIDEFSHRKDLAGTMLGTSSVYKSLLKAGQQKKSCTVCSRHLNDQEMVVFEKYLNDMMKKTSDKAIDNNKAELAEWEGELARLQSLTPVQATRDQLKAKELPAMEEEIKRLETDHPAISSRAEEAVDELEAVKRQLKDILTLKQHALTVSRLQKEIKRAEEIATDIERTLAATGTTKTTDDIQLELDVVVKELRQVALDRGSITADRDRQNNIVRTHETSLHQMELKERDLLSEIREKNNLEEQVVKMKNDVVLHTAQLKDIDGKILEAEAPIEALQNEQHEVLADLNSKISHAQRLSQELNISVDKLQSMNKSVERYVKEKRGRDLEECGTKIENSNAEIAELTEKIDAVREVVGNLEKEINESGASVASLRENLRLRKLAKDIQDTQTEIDSYDMEEAAKARRNFANQWGPAKNKENELHTAYNHLAGELSSQKSQLRSLESDFKEFKDINKKYTEQLVRVKVSDMANSDLEKYAKALDNAIMKYHGLKMEEVNDTMKHLWNKTYQGTDIDGIKIRSDVEGGASKRSYNYRVVMTKDQVEMDMRGRCSAGQKMLASIIIRLALSDSFGQNCGILALDEPTNALDTENIDALAASLVDIINERKSHSNFQLIIITHDENFLQKLGQNDVMEYYWRVSRDSRQKSVIERRRFR